MRSQALLTTFVSAVTLVACGGGDSPSAPSATTQSITVSSSSDLLQVGASETFTATATMSDGSTRTLTGGVWGTDAPFVATVESGTGRVTGVGSGMATIFVDAQGRRGSKLVRGLPSYQGTWSGSYAVTGCTQSGSFALANACRDTFAVNRVLPMNMVNTQTRDAVNGQFALGSISGSGSGPVQTNGELSFAGTARSGDLSIDTAWSMHSTQAGRITGSAGFILRFAGLSGEARVDVSIRDLNRTSNLQPGVAPPARTVRSLDDLRAALEGR